MCSKAGSSSYANGLVKCLPTLEALGRSNKCNQSALYILYLLPTMLSVALESYVCIAGSFEQPLQLSDRTAVLPAALSHHLPGLQEVTACQHG